MDSKLFDRLTVLPEDSQARFRILQLMGTVSLTGALVRLESMARDQREIYEEGIARILAADAATDAPLSDPRGATNPDATP